MDYPAPVLIPSHAWRDAPGGRVAVLRSAYAAPLDASNTLGETPFFGDEARPELVAMSVLLDGAARVQAAMTDHDRLVMEMGLRAAHAEEAIAGGELARARAHLEALIEATHAAGFDFDSSIAAVTGALGAGPEPPPPGTVHLVWSEFFPSSGGDLTFKAGERYGVLASASKDYSLSEIRDYLTGKGFEVTYAWEWGTPTRGEYQIDDWLASLPQDQRSNHRWVWGEANRLANAGNLTIGQDAPWPLTIYHVAHAYHAVPPPPGGDKPQPFCPPPAQNLEGCPPIPSRTPYVIGAVVGMLAGIGAGILLGRAVF